MFIDSRNQVWFSIEYAGLYKLDQSSGEVTPYGVESGLTDTNVVGMLEDKSGYLWVSTYNGLFRYNPVNGKFIRFGKEDNLTSTQFNYNACFQEGDTMYFGSTGGLFSFKPEDIKYDGEQVNHVYFTNLELLNHENKVVSLYGIQPEDIHLSYDQNFFTIHFSTPELISLTRYNSLVIWRILKTAGLKSPMPDRYPILIFPRRILFLCQGFRQ